MALTQSTMTIRRIDEIVIYESPDGGKTVYSRRQGKVKRTLHHSDPEYEKEQELTRRWLDLKEAVFMADTDKALDYAIQRVEILYALKKDEN